MASRTTNSASKSRKLLDWRSKISRSFFIRSAEELRLRIWLCLSRNTMLLPMPSVSGSSSLSFRFWLMSSARPKIPGVLLMEIEENDTALERDFAAASPLVPEQTNFRTGDDHDSLVLLTE